MNVCTGLGLRCSAFVIAKYSDQIQEHLVASFAGAYFRLFPRTSSDDGCTIPLVFQMPFARRRTELSVCGFVLCPISLLTGDDEPKILAYAKTSKCSIGADVGHYGLALRARLRCGNRVELTPAKVRLWPIALMTHNITMAASASSGRHQPVSHMLPEVRFCILPSNTKWGEKGHAWHAQDRWSLVRFRFLIQITPM